MYNLSVDVPYGESTMTRLFLGLLERLKNGEDILIAEGYMWELERRGYLTAGGFIPEIVLDNPEVVRALHMEFIHAGTDVIEAFTVSYLMLL